MTRGTRLLATALVAAGAVGTAVTLAGGMSGADGTLAFPAAVVVGVAVLHHHRPKTFGPPPQQGTDARKGSQPGLTTGTIIAHRSHRKGTP